METVVWLTPKVSLSKLRNSKVLALNQVSVVVIKGSPLSSIEVYSLKNSYCGKKCTERTEIFSSVPGIGREYAILNYDKPMNIFSLCFNSNSPCRAWQKVPEVIDSDNSFFLRFLVRLTRNFILYNKYL